MPPLYYLNNVSGFNCRNLGKPVF